MTPPPKPATYRLLLAFVSGKEGILSLPQTLLSYSNIHAVFLTPGLRCRTCLSRIFESPLALARGLERREGVQNPDPRVPVYPFLLQTPADFTSILVAARRFCTRIRTRTR